MFSHEVYAVTIRPWQREHYLPAVVAAHEIGGSAHYAAVRLIAFREIFFMAQGKILNFSRAEKAQSVLGPESGDLIDVAHQNNIAAAHRPSRHCCRNCDFAKFPDNRKANRSEEIEDDKGTARVGYADLEEKCEKCQQKTSCEPTNEYFPGFNPRLRTIRKFVKSASTHSKDINKTRQQTDGAVRKHVRHRIACRKLVANPAKDAGQPAELRVV